MLTYMDVVCMDRLITGATKHQIIDHLWTEETQSGNELTLKNNRGKEKNVNKS